MGGPRYLRRRAERERVVFCRLVAMVAVGGRKYIQSVAPKSHSTVDIDRKDDTDQFGR